MKNSEAVVTKTTTPLVHTTNGSTKKPQWQVVLEELIESGEDGITSWDMIVKHHITRTAAHICTLKKMGYEIFSTLEYKDGKNYSRYWMEVEEDEEDFDDDDCAYHDYVDEPYVNEDRLRNIAKWEALGSWMSGR